MEIINNQYGEWETAIFIVVLRMLVMKLPKVPVHK